MKFKKSLLEEFQQFEISKIEKRFVLGGVSANNDPDPKSPPPPDTTNGGALDDDGDPPVLLPKPTNP